MEAPKDDDMINLMIKRDESCNFLSFKVCRCLGLFIFINFVLAIFKVLYCYCIRVVVKIYNLSIYTSVDQLILWRRQSQKIIRTPRRSYSNFKM